MTARGSAIEIPAKDLVIEPVRAPAMQLLGCIAGAQPFTASDDKGDVHCFGLSCSSSGATHWSLLMFQASLHYCSVIDPRGEVGGVTSSLI